MFVIITIIMFSISNLILNQFIIINCLMRLRISQRYYGMSLNCYLANQRVLIQVMIVIQPVTLMNFLQVLVITQHNTWLCLMIFYGWVLVVFLNLSFNLLRNCHNQTWGQVQYLDSVLGLEVPSTLYLYSLLFLSEYLYLYLYLNTKYLRVLCKYIKYFHISAMCDYII